MEFDGSRPFNPNHNAPLLPDPPQQEQERMGNKNGFFGEEWVDLEDALVGEN